MKKWITRFSLLLLTVTLLFFSYLFLKRNLTPHRIAIQPLSTPETKSIEEVKLALQEFYEYDDIRILPTLKIPKQFFTKVKSPRFRADSLINFLRTDGRFEEYDYVVGITDQDISVTKYSNFFSKEIKQPTWKYEDWGVFGYGYVPGKSCIVSSYRLKKGVSQQIYIDRLRKIVCHEHGHNLGLPHCADKKCFMQDAAETIKTIDNVEENMCMKCKALSSLGF